MKKLDKKLYDTTAKKLKFLRKKGSLVTFKNPFYPKGIQEDGKIQLIVQQFHQPSTGGVQLIGTYYDSDWYSDLGKLLEAVNWEWMEEAHQF